MKVVAASLALLLSTAACERAGADFENRSSRPVSILAELTTPPDGSDGVMPFEVAPNETVQSVWYVNEHKRMSFVWQSGARVVLDGKNLTELARMCPKHCILRVSESGVVPVQTNFFGRPEN
ncbi:MAG: hypothetical protein M3Q83_04730 [Pseudomonadota bacterium]|nr:hypothetical protein [Pseudomonadota bacterium]